MIENNPTIGLGTGTLGGLFRRISEKEAFAIFDHAWENGIRDFDTATWYGAGYAESLIGKWMVVNGVRRQEVFIYTKIARDLLDPTPSWPVDPNAYPKGATKHQVFNYTRDGALKQAQVSLDLLQTDYFDALLLHEIDTFNHKDKYHERLTEAMAGTYVALQELKRKGVTRRIGIGVNNYQPFDDVIDYLDQSANNKRPLNFDCGVLAGRYTLLEQDSLNTLNRASREGIEIYAAGLLNSGILAQGYSNQTHYNYVPASNAPPEIREKAIKLKDFCSQNKVPLGAAALQFAGGHPAVSKFILGPDNLDELKQCLEWIRYPIPTTFWANLRNTGLINSGAPLPGEHPRPSPKLPSTIKKPQA